MTIYRLYEDDPAYVFDDRKFTDLDTANIAAKLLHAETGHQTIVFIADADGDANWHDSEPVTIYNYGRKFERADD